MSAGMLDTSVVIDWDDPVVAAALPDESAISAVTMAELAAGPILAASPLEGARRQFRLQQVEAAFEPIPFDVAAARSFGQVVAAVISAGRSHKGRMADLMIAAIAHANNLELYTRNGDDFGGLESILHVVVI